MTAQNAHRNRLLALICVLVLITAAAGSCNDDNGNGPTVTDPPTTTTTEDTTPSALPDFVITAVSVPTGLVPPGTVRITATVTNIGSADYAQAIVVQAPGNHTGVITGLAAGASGDAIIDYPAVSSNVTYTMTLIVDPDNVTPEQNENNNESTTFTIRTTP